MNRELLLLLLGVWADGAGEGACDAPDGSTVNYIVTMNYS
jgi:hypothetical protein